VFAAKVAPLGAMLRTMRGRPVPGVFGRALAPALLWLLACGTARPLATALPPVAEREKPNDAAISAAGASAREPSLEQRELEQTFGDRKAQKTLLGEASYYSDALAGRKTASGEPYDPKAYTAAHRSLPFGTVLRVQRKDTGGVVYVRVNDRGPFGKRHRILDLSKAAAEHLGMIRRGIADVRIEVVEQPAKKR
jgi:rare lipoprotein A